MSSAMLDQLRDSFEGKIPFQGQRLADRLNQEIIIIGAVVAWLVGYFADSLFFSMIIFGAAFSVAFVLCVPAWPMYQKHPVIWLPNLPSTAELEKSAKES